MSFETWMCGWEAGNWQWEFEQSDDHPTSWSVTSAARKDTTHTLYGLRITATGATSLGEHQLEGSTTGATCGKLDFRFPSGLPSADAVFVRWQDSAVGTRYELMFRDSDDSIVMRALDGGLVLETEVGPVIASNTWYRLDFLVGDSSSGQRRMEWAIDGTEYGVLGPDDNYLGGLFAFALGHSSGTFTVDIDDILMIQSSDGAETPEVEALFPIGECYVKGLRPNGVGTHNNSGNFTISTGTLADSWQLLDNDPLPGSGFIEQDVSGGHYLEYTLTDLDSDETNILSVSAIMGYRSASASTANFGLQLISGVDNIGTISRNGISASEVRCFCMEAGWDPDYYDRPTVNDMVIRAGFSNDVSPNPQWYGILVYVAIGPFVPEPDEVGWGVLIS